MDAAGWGALGAVLYGLIREVVGGLIQIMTARGNINKAEKDEELNRYKTMMEEMKKEVKEAKERADTAEQEAKAAQQAQIECEKNSIRLEARIELLTRLYGVQSDSTETRRALTKIETEIAQKKSAESKSSQ